MKANIHFWSYLIQFSLEKETFLTKVTEKINMHIIFSVTFLTLNEVYPCFFPSCKANARVKLAKTGHGPHSSKLVVICVVLLLFVLFYVLFVCKCVLYYCHRVTTQLQLTNISYHIILYHITLYHISYHISYRVMYRIISYILYSSNTWEKMGTQWGSASALYRLQESLWFS